MKREALEVEKRSIAGKKVKKLRADGILPGNVFGKGMDSISIQLPLKDFITLYKKVHETGLVDITIDGEKYPTLIQNVQVHPLSHTPIHADFFKVNLKEKVKATIPIIAVGEPKAVTDKIGVLLQPLSEVEVEALPAELPEHIEVNVENLSEIDQSISIEDLKFSEGVEIMAEASEMVFRIGELVSEAAEELAAEEEAAAEAASEENAAEGGEAESDETGEGESSESPSEDSEKPEEKPQE